MAHRWAFA